MSQPIFWAIPAASAVALAFAAHFYRQMKTCDEGTPTMRRIAQHVRDGAMAYLKQQYKIVAAVFVVLAVLFAVLAANGLQNPVVPVAFLTGGFFSGLAGFFGMKTATYASARTARAAQNSLDSGLKVAFRSGAVMGLVVVGLGLLDISLWALILDCCAHWIDETATGTHKMIFITTTMLTFGMGADLYESYCGSILATAALGAAAFVGFGADADVSVAMQIKAVLAPMLIAAVGILLSIFGIYLVRTKEGATMKNLLGALGRGVNISSALIVVATFAILRLLDMPNWVGVSLAVVVGLIAGIVIGQATEYYTSHSYKPTRRVAESAKTGPATVIISGIGLGMLSTCIPVVTIVVAIVLSFIFAAGGFGLRDGVTLANVFSAENLGFGLYGIGIAAVGMLSTLGITLATDAYGPIADNAGGNAEMSGLEPEVRRRTDALDALGNTTAATGKGFAIGSAALTALALLASYIEEIRIALLRIVKGGGDLSSLPDALRADAGTTAQQLAEKIQTANFVDFMAWYDVTLMNPRVLAGMFVGSMMAFLFCGLTMNAVGRAAQSMVVEVRRQFKEIPGILEGKGTPDYARCVAISTKGAQREMLVPSLIAIVVPILTGVVLGIAGVMGLLVGGLAAGFVLAVFMANSGGAWDNAKKFIEEGNFGGKGSERHKATVVGDTVGDPFKDTSGPSLNILIKLMSMVAIVVAGLTAAWSLF
ncbi:MAG TPA: sodium-translocating pyrophosphatase [Candidatus Spyradosoma merdigallinarum]|uniref:Putative K(+)-stimulated pyrophosphate-energized sodium pump n=1 Tax=Candidatus Spyradosoma merdigallinarum TaxID=2840950 RepID=A0A9D1T162_9BACT|nr:sodium-translocating pyrophosphatase [Candidatus Spyradosoma merdigallinarum]